MNTCPKCGHKWHDEKRASGGKARWRGMNKAQRKKAASDAAKARWAKRPNAEVSGGALDASAAKAELNRPCAVRLH
jgi:hypothetical protein